MRGGSLGAVAMSRVPMRGTDRVTTPGRHDDIGPAAQEKPQKMHQFMLTYINAVIGSLGQVKVSARHGLNGQWLNDLMV